VKICDVISGNLWISLREFVDKKIINFVIIFLLFLIFDEKKKYMSFQKFRNTFYDQIYITSNQVNAWRPDFSKNNLGRWVKNGYLIKLRNGHYIFSEYLNQPNINLFVANRIYRPSYISLHAALSFYGLIPEAVVRTTSVTPLKTMSFVNPLGSFSYKSIKESFFFGYSHLPFHTGKSILMATPEKALLDLLYLYPFYNSKEELLDLRLDEELMQELVNPEVLYGYLGQIKSGALEKRCKELIHVYQLT
jgi:predicted transcriptional regulator of viral defense system